MGMVLTDKGWAVFEGKEPPEDLLKGQKQAGRKTKEPKEQTADKFEGSEQ